MKEVLKFTPLYKERVWGGNALKETLKRQQVPDNQKIGESWEIVDRKDAQSVVIEGRFKTLTLRELLKKYSEPIMGPHYDPERPFPILVKWLDCCERLSLQVHPPENVASKLGGEPKTEHWYIAKASEDAAILVGLKKGTSHEDFLYGLKTNNLEPCVQRIGVKEGDAMFVPSGRIHAIDKGNLILEIQQNSDTTYRVYDWGRLGLDGKPRKLHIEESLQSIDFDDIEPEVTPAADGNRTLADSCVFRLQQIDLSPEDKPLSFQENEQPRLLHVISGSLETDSGQNLSYGENVLIPYAFEGSFKAIESTRILVTDHFVKTG